MKTALGVMVSISCRPMVVAVSACLLLGAPRAARNCNLS
jgi:hypothetical protein